MRKIKTAPLIPTTFEINEISDNELQLKVSPFEIGFAVTFAHPLKRLLMSSSIGYAPVAIKVENASHEFDNIPGMLEDISGLIINLKSIRFKLKDGVEKAEASYSFKGPQEIHGSDLATDEIEIVTPDNFLATLNEDGELQFKILIYKGIGYVPSEDIRTSLLDRVYKNEVKDFIPLDAYFTPVRKADYRIENILVEDNPNFEEINFNIVTDGQASPKDIFINTLKVMKQQISIFDKIYMNEDDNELPDNIQKSNFEAFEHSDLSENEEDIIRKLLIRLKDFGLKPRVANALISAEYNYAGDVAFLEEKDLKEIKNFGAGSISDLKTALEKAGIDKDSLSFFSEKAKAEYKKRSER
jgi:DNA-directed RNA polymerase subunit alpha